MPDDDEKALLERIEHEHKEKGSGNVEKLNRKSSYGTNHDGFDLPSQIVHDEPSPRMSEWITRAGSYPIFPYDMNQYYETIDDLRGSFQYSTPPSTGCHW